MLALIPLAISIVPEISKWLFGDSSTATKTASEVASVVQSVTGADPSTADGLAAVSAVLAGKPELASQLQVQISQIAANREKEQRDADAAALTAAFADVANARAQTVSLAAAHSPLQWAAPFVSAIVLLTFGTVMALGMFQKIPSGSEALVNQMMGFLGAMATAVVSYWVGSSAGSAAKTAMIYNSTPTPPSN